MMSEKDNEILVEVKGVSKKFSHTLRQSMWYGLQDLGRSIIGGGKPSTELREGEFWAVKDIDFTLRRGECLGLIGHNGAGKSTLLKMLNGLIRPDEGSITMRGKVGALIELGAGFNPLLTGRENIYVNGQLLGFTKKEIDSKLEAILDFAEIGEFIDSPVQNYSSGMKVRLGFAVASQMEPDILLIDEVLAVGDMGFVLKCYNQIDKMLLNTAVIFVSHRMPQVSRICSKLILMDHGKLITCTNEVPKGISQYYDKFSSIEKPVFSSGEANLESISILNTDNTEFTDDLIEINQGDSFRVTIVFRLFSKIKNPKIVLVFRDIEERAFAEVLNFQSYCKYEHISGLLRVSADFEKIVLTQGLYSISVSLTDEYNLSRKDILRIQSAIKFKIISEKHGWVPVQFQPKWEINKL